MLDIHVLKCFLSRLAVNELSEGGDIAVIDAEGPHVFIADAAVAQNLDELGVEVKIEEQTVHGVEIEQFGVEYVLVAHELQDVLLTALLQYQGQRFQLLMLREHLKLLFLRRRHHHSVARDVRRIHAVSSCYWEVEEVLQRLLTERLQRNG